jgi:hypothetical protein
MLGLKIVGVRKLTKKEIKAEGWDGTTMAIVLSDGTLLYASRDEEGNGPGQIFGKAPDGKAFRLIPS